jgi:hypothetical protein
MKLAPSNRATTTMSMVAGRSDNNVVTTLQPTTVQQVSSLSLSLSLCASVLLVVHSRFHYVDAYHRQVGRATSRGLEGEREWRSISRDARLLRKVTLIAHWTPTCAQLRLYSAAMGKSRL